MMESGCQFIEPPGKRNGAYVVEGKKKTYGESPSKFIAFFHSWDNIGNVSMWLVRVQLVVYLFTHYSTRSSYTVSISLILPDFRLSFHFLPFSFITLSFLSFTASFAPFFSFLLFFDCLYSQESGKTSNTDVGKKLWLFLFHLRQFPVEMILATCEFEIFNGQFYLFLPCQFLAYFVLSITLELSDTKF